MTVRTVQPTDAQIPGASVTPSTVNVILQFFPVHIKMFIITHVLSKKHQVTVKFTGHASVELVSCTFLAPKIWGWLSNLYKICGTLMQPLRCISE